MKVKTESEVTESCPTLSDPMDCSPLGSSVHGIFQARVLEWGAIAFSVGHAGTHLFPASVALCLLQMRAEIRGHVQPHKGTEEETKASRKQKDHLTPEPVLLLPAASYSGVQSGSRVRRAKLDGRNMRRGGPSSQADQGSWSTQPLWGCRGHRRYK